MGNRAVILAFVGLGLVGACAACDAGHAADAPAALEAKVARRAQGSRVVPAALALEPASAAVREDLLARTLAYFVDHTHPVSGLTRDRAKNFGDTPPDMTYRRASIAATGFGMAVLAHAARTGRIDPARADRAILAALDTAAKMPDFHGWLYHFVDWETADRFPRSEISTIDTTWFIAGALYAGAVSGDPRVASAADALYERLDFGNMLTDGGTHPDKPTLSMGYVPETGYIATQWSSYAEQMLLLLLGLGQKTAPLAPAAWRAFDRPTVRLPSGDALIGADLPLFTHQYTQLFVDLRGKNDGFGDYERNTELATERDRDFCRAAASTRATYRAGFWGLSASDGPAGYAAFSPLSEDGTVCLNCAGASAAFLPTSVLGDLATWSTGPLAARIYGRYGFADAVNLDDDYVDEDVIGITVGALYLALADADPATAVWPDFATIPGVERGLAAAFPSASP